MFSSLIKMSYLAFRNWTVQKFIKKSALYLGTSSPKWECSLL